MALLKVYLPDDLAEEVRQADLNVSNIAREALRHELANRCTSAWLAKVRTLPFSGVTHEEVIAALDEIRAESGDD